MATIPAFILEVDETGTPQSPTDNTFIGGIPKLPPGTAIPQCMLCENEMAFFFQIAFPSSHSWAEESLAVFACVACQSDEHCIPEMLTEGLRGANIPAGFLTSYQRNFRLLPFMTGNAVPVEGYQEAVRFQRWKLIRVDDEVSEDNDETADSESEEEVEIRNKVGGVPTWYLDDEAPNSYDSTTPMCFLLQIEPEYEFEILPTAPRQMEVEYSEYGGQIGVIPTNKDFYELFLANALYFFGTLSLEQRLIYVLTQI